MVRLLPYVLAGMGLSIAAMGFAVSPGVAVTLELTWKASQSMSPLHTLRPQ